MARIALTWTAVTLTALFCVKLLVLQVSTSRPVYGAKSVAVDAPAIDAAAVMRDARKDLASEAWSLH